MSQENRCARFRGLLCVALAVMGWGCEADDWPWPGLETGARQRHDPVYEDYVPASDESICHGEGDLRALNRSPDEGAGPFDRVFVDRYAGAAGSLHWNVLPGEQPRAGFAPVSGRRYCSGVLIDHNLFLTAGHCLDASDPHYNLPAAVRAAPNLEEQAAAACARMHVDFGYARDANGDFALFGETGTAHHGHSFPCVDVLEIAVPRAGAAGAFEPDYAILQLGEAPIAGRAPGWPGEVYPQVSLSADGVGLGAPIIAFQHPDGWDLHMDDGVVGQRQQSGWLGYDVETRGGSSGAGLLDGSGQLVGLHLRGGCECAADVEPGARCPEFVAFNRGLSIEALAEVSGVLSGLRDEPCRDEDDDGAFDVHGCQSVACRVAGCDPARLDCNDARDGVRPEAPEVCNGIDDDCDGTVDEGVDAVSEGQEGLCRGRPGCIAVACVDGGWRCAALPQDAPECPTPSAVCGLGRLGDATCSDGIDNDCDGIVDEHDPGPRCARLLARAEAEWGPSCGSPVGLCRQSPGRWGCIQRPDRCDIDVACVDDGRPQPELCDGSDADCDGRVDERGDVDGDGFGTCPDRLDCRPDDPEAYPGAAERLDGLDDDCDGRIDEDAGWVEPHPDDGSLVFSDEAPFFDAQVLCPADWTARGAQWQLDDRGAPVDLRLACHPLEVLHEPPDDGMGEVPSVRPIRHRMRWSPWASGLPDGLGGAVEGLVDVQRSVGCGDDDWLGGIDPDSLEPVCARARLYRFDALPPDDPVAPGRCAPGRVVSGVRAARGVDGAPLTALRLMCSRLTLVPR